MTDEQKELFPMAGHIVEKLTDYSGSIIREIERLDEAIEKKQGEIKALHEKLEDVQIALKEAAQIHAELTPKQEGPTELIDFVPPRGEAVEDGFAGDGPELNDEGAR